MKSLVLFLMLVIAPPLFSQGNQRPPTPPEVEVERLRIQAEERARRDAEMRDWETKIFPIKHVQPQRLRTALSMFQAQFQEEPVLKVMSVRAPKEIMPAIEAAIKMLDVPSAALSKTAELTVYVLLATEQQDPTKTIPAVLRPVIDQLKNVMAYKGYQVLDTIIAKGGERGGTSSGGVLPPLYRDSGQPSEYRFFTRLFVETPEGKPPVLRVTDMQFTLTVDIGNAVANPALPQGMPIGPPRMAQPTITTDVEIPAGQQVVVGKATLGANAVILVMSAKFLD